MSTPIVEIAHLRKAYRSGSVDTQVLRDITLSFKRGTFTAVVGQSGCGKTTLLNLLGGLDQADSGSLVVGGLDLAKASNRELTDYRKRDVGFIFQFFNLLPTLNAVENVESGLEFLPLGSSARRRRAMDYLERVGMAEMAHRFPAQLSGGQQQRVAVARALAREPRLLLADEPTGNLDAETGERVVTLIRELVRDSRVTCILVTHDKDLAARVDDIVRLRDGRVLERPISIPAAAESGLRLVGGTSFEHELQTGLRRAGGIK